MNFDLSDDQLALRAGADSLLADLASPSNVRRFTETAANFDTALWDAIVAQGWLVVDVAEADGGLGFGAIELAVIAEAIGARAAPVPFVSTMLAARAATPAAAARAAELRTGTRIAAVAWSRDPSAVRAEQSGAGWHLTGRADPVEYGSAAHDAVVTAATDDGPAVFLVDLADVAAGSRARQPALDVTRPLAWLRFDATPAVYLGDHVAVDRLIDEGAVLTAAQLLGSGQTVLDLAVAYAQDRVQFGKPIGSFQAVKHRCADMLVDVEGMRSTTLWAAWVLAAGGAGEIDPAIAASTAKTWCADASTRVLASALQVHGGVGFTWEHDLHFFFKRAQLDRLTFGDARMHRERLAARLRVSVDAGSSIV